MSNHITKKYVGGGPVTNTGTDALTGPFQLKLSGLTGSIILDNASGSDGGTVRDERRHTGVRRRAKSAAHVHRIRTQRGRLYAKTSVRLLPTMSAGQRDTRP